MNNTNKNIFTFAVAALVILIIQYANHFNNGFHFDDFHAVFNNIYIRSLKNIPTFFVDPKMFSADPSHWGLRSLVTTTLAIDYWLGDGLYPFWFQLSTFIWHIGLCILLFFLYRKILRSAFSEESYTSWLAFAAAACFGLHKINAETLNYIISRSDVLSTFMIVLSLYVFIGWPAKRKYGLYILPAFLGVFAKETVPVLLIIMFFYILLFEKKLSITDLFKAKNFRVVLNILWLMLPLVILVVATQLYTLTRIKSVPGISNPLLPYVLTQTYIWVHYFLDFFLPFNVSADSDWKIINPMYDERIIIGCMFIVVLVVTIFKTSKKDETKPIAFGLIWFAATLLPTSLAPFAEVTNDHRMYFPFIGLALSTVTYAGLLIKRYKSVLSTSFYKNTGFAVLVIVLCLNAYGVYCRNEVWHTEESLWHDVTLKSPENGRGLMNYALTQMDKGNFVVADYYYKKARIYSPEYSDLYINMGILAGDMHKPQEAEQDFKAAIVYAPEDFNSYVYYAQFLLHYGRANDALTMALKAVKLNPYSELSESILMSIYNEQEQWKLLEQTATRMLTLWPNDAEAKTYLKAAQSHMPVLSDSDKYDTRKALSAADYLNMSLVYYNNGMYVKCITTCQQALKLKPDYADAYSNIGAAYNKLKQWDNAIEACKKALAINPKHKLATGNLKLAEDQQKLLGK